MVIDSILALLNGVRKCGAGWMARCSGHPDKRPTLAISKGDRGILLHCFAGCTVSEICTALGIRVADLFYTPGQPINRQTIRKRKADQEDARRREKAAFLKDARKVDCLREADAVINAATGIDISTWSDAQLDDAIDVTSCAWRPTLHEDRKEVLRGV